MKLTALQKILSLFYPVRIATAKGATTPLLTLYRFQGRWQLSAATALYSDGADYRPLTTAFHYLKAELPAKKRMLVLGAGLGSAFAILKKKRYPLPHTTMVDIDAQVIAWAQELFPEREMEWVCADVQDFARSSSGKKYDLLIIDVFLDRLVPQFVTKRPFLEACRSLLAPGPGSVAVLNYIVNNDALWQAAQNEIGLVFKVEHVISIGINRILILRNNA